MFFKNKNQKIYNDEIVQLLNKIEQNNQLIKYEYNFKNSKLSKISADKSFNSSITSNEIEGVVISKTNTDETNKINQQIINNYSKALDYIKNNYSQINFCEKEILLNHKILFSQTPYEQSQEKYKQFNNLIVDSKTKKIIEKTVDANNVQSTINELIFWFINETSMNQLIKSIIFIYDFLKIHPFEDGNGRVSRLLSNLLFLQSNCEFLKYTSIEEFILKDVQRYYLSLKARYENEWFDHEIDYTQWIKFNLDQILNCQIKFIDLCKMFDYVNEASNKSNKIIRWFEFNKNKEMKTQEVFYELSEYFDISNETIRKTLSNLIRSGFIVKIGNGKKTCYVKKE